MAATITDWYGLELSTEEQATLAADPKNGLSMVLGGILENGHKARQAKAAGDMTETHQVWEMRCDALLAITKKYMLAAIQCPAEWLDLLNKPLN